MPASEFLRARFLDVAFDGPRFVALYRGDPADGGVEVAGNGYRRAPVDFIRNGGVASNVGEVIYPVAEPAEWGEITHFGVFDGRGNLLVHDALEKRKTIEDGDQFVWREGQLTYEFEGGS